MCIGLLAVISPIASAQQDRASQTQAEFTELFASVCLMKFPDAGAVSLYASAKGFTVMPEARLRAMLGTDPGAGWLYETPLGTYAVTIEQPPLHTCAIRRRFDKPVDIRTPMGMVLTLWAGSQRMGALKELPMREVDVSGAKTDTYLWEIAAKGGTETFMAMVTPVANESIEIRLVRAIGNR
jgi:hypothetical protein